MPLTSVDLLAPTGDIEASFFPKDDAPVLGERLDAYLAEGYAKASALTAPADRDAAALAWAYHRAYRAIAARLAAQPATVSLDGGMSRTYTAAQVQHFTQLADGYAAEFDVWVVAAAANRVLVPSPYPVRDLLVTDGQLDGDPAYRVRRF